jgi:hypothetical protein
MVATDDLLEQVVVNQDLDPLQHGPTIPIGLTRRETEEQAKGAVR